MPATALPKDYFEQHGKVRTIPKMASVLPMSYHTDTMLNSIPDFLRAKRDAQRVQNVVSSSLRRETDWAPIGAARRDMPPQQSNLVPKGNPKLFVDDESLPVCVLLKLKGENRPLADYPDFATFKATHDMESYPVSRATTVTDAAVLAAIGREPPITMVTVTAKPWAKAHLSAEEQAPVIPRKPREGRSKVDVIADLLVRPEGCTRGDVLAATGWPSVSMPQQAKLAGLTLKTVKEKGSPTRYWGSK